MPDVPWLPLVLDEGQPGQAEGRLVVVDGRPFIVGDGGSVVRVGGATTAVTMAVPLDVDESTAGDRVKYEGRQVVATGVLRSRQLSLRSLAPRSVETAVEAASTRRSAEPCELRAAGSYELRSEVEADLMEQGVLLDAWDDPRTGRRVALAVNVSAVSNAFDRHRAPAYTIVESKWDSAYLDKIRDSVDGDVVVSYGNTISATGQLQAAMTLLHLPPRTAHALARFRPDAITVSVLVTPPVHQSNPITKSHRPHRG